MWWFVFQIIIVAGMIWIMRAVPELWPKDDAFLTAMLPVAAAFFATHFLRETIDDWRAWRRKRREAKENRGNMAFYKSLIDPKAKH
jgi:hypothetical protein